MNGHFKKYCFIIMTCLCFLGFLSVNAQLTKAQKKAETQAKIRQLEKGVKNLDSLHKNLQESRDQVEKLRHKATITFQDNAYRIYMKGVLDIYDKVSGPGAAFNEALSMSIEIYKNIYWEPKLWQERNEKVAFKKMHDNALRRSGKIKRMFGDLAVILKAPLERFDDDQYPLRSAKYWWRVPDGKKDDNVELITRKMFIIKNLSELVVKQMDWELKEIRQEKQQLLAKIAEMKNGLVDPVITEVPRQRSEFPRVIPSDPDWLLHEWVSVYLNYEQAKKAMAASNRAQADYPKLQLKERQWATVNGYYRGQYVWVCNARLNLWGTHQQRKHAFNKLDGMKKTDPGLYQQLKKSLDTAMALKKKWHRHRFGELNAQGFLPDDPCPMSNDNSSGDKCREWVTKEKKLWNAHFDAIEQWYRDMGYPAEKYKYPPPPPLRIPSKI